MELIHGHVYDPKESLFRSSKNDRAASYKIQCKTPSGCALFKRGECALVSSFGGTCPYGKVSRRTGYTPRARGFHAWIRKEREFIGEALGKLKRPTRRMAKVNQHIFLPYPHLDDKIFSHAQYVLEQEFNAEWVIENILDRRPQALFGGSITSFQKETVPLFLKHLKEVFPNIHKDLPQERLTKYTYTDVGRKAYIHTLKANITIGEFIWDGEWLVQKTKVNPIMFPVDTIKELKIAPGKDAVVKVRSNDWVLSSTKFKD